MSTIATIWAYQQRVGHSIAKQLLCFLASNNFNKPGFHYKNSTLANILEVSERSIKNAKEILIDKELIKVEPQFDSRGKQIHSVIYLNIPDEEFNEVIHKMEGKGGTTCTPSLSQAPRARAPGTTCTHPSKKQHISNSNIKENFKNSFPNSKYKANNKYNNKEQSKERTFCALKDKSKRPDLKYWEPGHPDYDRNYGNE